jgi:hypothetical protein
MQSLTKLRLLAVSFCACVGLLMSAPVLAGGWHGGGGYGSHGGYGYHGGYYGGWHGGYYGWRGGYYGWPGYYYGPWGWWGGYGYWPYYATLPYYYPSYGSYPSYGWGGGPHENVGPPAGAANQGDGSPGPLQQPVVNPKNGQTQEQQGKDTYECHRWAVGQTGFDPTQGVPGNRSEYFRAQAACLEGRGYTVN